MNFWKKGGRVGVTPIRKISLEKRNIVCQNEGRGGGAQRLFGVFPKIHPFWQVQTSLPIDLGRCEEIYRI